MSAWQNRIVDSGDENPEQLLANPGNWRIHPKAQQDALSGVLDQVGWVDQIIVNRTTGHVVDGHLRVSLALRRNEPTVPVLYVDLEPHEEALVLATLDPIAAMAAADKEQLDALLREVQTGDAAVMAMIEGLAVRAGIIPPVDFNAEWQGMPEFEQEDLTAYQSIHVHFKTQADVEAFAALIGQKIGQNVRSIWYPAAEKIDMGSEDWRDGP